SEQRHNEAGPIVQPKTDKEYLATRQYRDASNLNARGSLHARFGTNPYPWFRWLFDQLLTLAPADAHILEVGCGPAGLWAENQDRLPPGWRMTLTDLSEGMVVTARERLAAAGAPEGIFTIQTADIESLPFADASFDVAVANHMLYHVPDLPKALSELRRALRPGGALLAATNGQDNMRELDDLFDGFVSAHDREWKASFRHPFTLENGAEQLAPYFDAIEIRPYEDSLRVTDEDALVAYCLSIDIPGLREPERQAALAARIHERMAAQGGVFTITKSVGAFTARRS
ncbi:MAG TPA: methyltransferase domain-containing protein, partial [Ktedonobacterales bacterium]|nr:methyltransferase domain-containing protein [Ktedonobacterales bacterium]